MGKNILCIGAISGIDKTICEQIPMIKEAGFDAFFTRWDKNIAKYKDLSEKYGLIYQSIHAPNDKTEKLWECGHDTELAIQEWMNCIYDCAKYGIPIMVCHAFRGIGKAATPNSIGIKNFGHIVKKATDKNVKIAFENTEGEECLAALLDEFSNCKNVGFCWDTGHELCYNKQKNMMAIHGKQIFCTHLNDNKGIGNTNGEISSDDDLHLLPFDGKNDWCYIVSQLNDVQYDGILTFEVKKSKFYSNLSTEEYFKEAYARACRISELKVKGANYD